MYHSIDSSPVMDDTSLLTPYEQQLLLSLAYDAVEATLQQRPATDLAALLQQHSLEVERHPTETSALYAHLGAFVSLYVAGDLRGCIGSFRSNEPLWKNVQEMARYAATRDPRFTPIQLIELAQMRREISVLTDPTPITGPDDVVVGRDGLIVESPTRRGVLLPQVATRYNWSAEEFLQHTCLKASLPPSAWQEQSIQLARFQAVIVSDPLATSSTNL